ncbi:MAG: CaiB/BaiF CoA transferase family protein [Hyphomonadaceae bacterium]
MPPLQGVKVLDLGSVLMAPYAGQWLADLGADVIKVEPPAGDSTRNTGPAAEANMASMFLGLNRSKRSIVLDLKTPAARAALLRLAEDADILLHNNRPQKMKALGLDAAALLARNPRLVYACLHGFTEAGPYGGKPAYDDVIQGLCGLADVMSRQAGAPRYAPFLAADKTSGLIGVIAILAALSKRDRTGAGGYVEVPMFESMIAYTAADHWYARHIGGEAGYPRVLTPERRPYATADGYLCVTPYTDKHWANLFTECGRSDLAGDPRFTDIGARTRHIAALYGELAALLTQRTTAAWLTAFERLEIPAGPVNALGDLPNDPHLAATGFFTTIAEDGAQPMLFPGVPVLFDGERPPIAAPPRLGEHTHEVLAEAGFSDAEIAALA